MLSRTNDIVRFRYKYVFYYFIASYLRDHLDDLEIRSHIQTLVANTHRRRSADILLFLAHLTKNAFVVQALLKAAEAHYHGVPKVTRFDEVTLPGSLLETVERVAYEERDVKDARREVALTRDNFEEDSELRLNKEDELVGKYEPNQARRLRAPHNAGAGAILKNYPGHLEADTKLSLAVATFGIGSRAWRAVFESLLQNEEEVARHLISALRKDDRGSDNPSGLTDRAQAAIKALVFMCGLGVTKRIADAIGSPELGPTYEKLAVAEEESEAVRMVGLAIKLEHSSVLPEAEIREVAGYIKKSPLGYWILQQLTLNHFHLFQVPAVTKQRICAVLDVKYTSGMGSSSRPKLLSPKGK